MKNTVKVTCTQKDDAGNTLFSVSKEDNNFSGQVNSINLSEFIINVLALNIQLAKLTGNKNQPKLSKPIQVDYSIKGKKSTVEIKFSLSDKRIEVLRGRLPKIFLIGHKLQKLTFRSESFVTTDGKLVLAEAVKKAKDQTNKIAAEVVTEAN